MTYEERECQIEEENELKRNTKAKLNEMFKQKYTLKYAPS